MRWPLQFTTLLDTPGNLILLHQMCQDLFCPPRLGALTCGGAAVLGVRETQRRVTYVLLKMLVLSARSRTSLVEAVFKASKLVADPHL
jgi:hypothetical protein